MLEGARMEGYKEGLEIGYKEGLEIGYKEDSIAIARKMKAYGVAWDMIAEITGLTIDEVKDLE